MRALGHEGWRLLCELRARAAAEDAASTAEAVAEAKLKASAVAVRTRRLAGETAALDANLVRLLESIEEEGSSMPAGEPYSDNVIDRTVLALASALHTTPGAVVELSDSFVNAVLDLAPWIWWKHEGRIQMEPYRVPDVERSSVLATTRRLIASGCEREAFEGLPYVASLLRRHAECEMRQTACGARLEETLENVEGTCRIALALSGKVTPALRYDVWRRVATELTGALQTLLLTRVPSGGK